MAMDMLDLQVLHASEQRVAHLRTVVDGLGFEACLLMARKIRNVIVDPDSDEVMVFIHLLAQTKLLEIMTTKVQEEEAPEGGVA